jgi:hypothetical protein
MFKLICTLIIFAGFSAHALEPRMKLTPEVMFQKLLKIESMLERASQDRAKLNADLELYEACEARCSDRFQWNEGIKNFSGGSDQDRMNCYKECERVRPVGVRDDC